MKTSGTPVALLRADANTNIGSGHAVRVLILADILLERGYEIIFLYRELPNGLIDSRDDVAFEKIGGGISELQATLCILTSHRERERIVITDSDVAELYSANYQQGIRASGTLLMTITFFADSHYYSDIVLNQNVRAPGLDYSVEPHTQLLLGLSYAVMKPAYQKLQRRGLCDFLQKKENLFLFFGGADTDDRTRWALKELQPLLENFEKVIVVVGLLYAHYEQLAAEISEMKLPIELHRNTPRMPELMAEAKYALVSGGLTCWELACTNTLCITIPYSEREVITCEYLHEKGWVHHLGCKNDHEPGSLVSNMKKIITDDSGNFLMAERMGKQVAVDGASRVVDCIVGSKRDTAG